jgi:transposase
MSSQGSADDREAGRRSAVQRVAEGCKQKDVAATIGVSDWALNGWAAAHRKDGDAGLKAKSNKGGHSALLLWYAPFQSKERRF